MTRFVLVAGTFIILYFFHCFLQMVLNSGGAICKKCWSFMTLSVKILDRALKGLAILLYYSPLIVTEYVKKEDFGFKHRLWVYSGRRGVHCWIADERARKLPAEARRAIVNYLEVVKGGENTEKKVNLRAQIHPSLK